MTAPARTRRYRFGPEFVDAGQVSLRVWAPDHAEVRAVVDGREWTLDRDDTGTHAGVVRAAAGSRYGFRLGRSDRILPDPASHFQPDGVEGLSEIVAHDRYTWTDAGWAGRPAGEHVLYELHCGTFTSEGTWRASRARLDQLAALGVTTIQVMPVNAFAGDYGWGYDGVLWYAPWERYGRPDDLRAFVDRAHACGLGVVLDVVYNHMGPRGSVLAEYAAEFFTDRYPNEWGASINFDGEGSAAVRAFVTANAAYWIREFHMDGLRIDAAQQMRDGSPTHVLTEVAAAARSAAPNRTLLLVAEDEPQQADLLRAPASGGSGLDVLYNDDFHHAARVRLTGWREAYYRDYAGSTSELLACVQHGFLYQGQRSGWQDQRRGTSALDLGARRFLCYLENHDQVANSTRAGLRLHQVTAPGMLRAFTALLLLGPWTPLLFQGQEHGVRQPWVYFADHPGDLGVQVREGRREFRSQFTRMPADADHDGHPDPMSPETYAACRLDVPDASAASGAAGAGSALWRLHHDLLGLRRALMCGGGHHRPFGAAPDDTLLLLRGGQQDAHWLLVMNLGGDRDVSTLASPLVAPPAGDDWRLQWSSEAVTYGGSGVPVLQPDRWLMPGASATLLVAGVAGLHDTQRSDDG